MLPLPRGLEDPQTVARAGAGRGRRVLRTGGILLLATILILAALEIAVRIVAPQSYHTAYAEGGPWALEDSVLGYVLRPRTTGEITGPEFRFRFTVDENGFRVDPGGPHPADPAASRILLVGDSFTFGAGNDAPDTWAEGLERRFLDSGRAVTVVNAGVLGYDTRTEVLALERLLPRLRPDLVVLTLLPNDLLVNEPLSADPLPYPGTGGRPGPGQLHLVRLATRSLLGVDRLYTAIYARTARQHAFRRGPDPIQDRQVEITGELLLRARNLCLAHGVAFRVLSIPQQFQVIASARTGREGPLDPGRVDERLGAFAAENGIPWIASLPDLAAAYAAGQEVYYRVDGHLTPAGNDVVAEVLFRALSAGS